MGGYYKYFGESSVHRRIPLFNVGHIISSVGETGVL